MKNIQLLLSAPLLTGTLLFSVQPLPAQEPSAGAGSLIILGRSGNYCHMKFPAIREDTLSGDHPILKDVDSNDIIDFYGPCDHNPIGKDEVHAQQIEMQRRLYRLLGE